MNEVKVYDANGNLVRTIPKEEVVSAAWDKFTYIPHPYSSESPANTSAWSSKIWRQVVGKKLTCKYCKKFFKSVKGRVNVFCSSVCRISGTNKKPTREKACRTCRKMFLPKYSNTLYCHNPCVRKEKR